MAQSKRKRIVFPWFGGKYRHLKFILPLIPTDATHFCDVFGGSASVLLNVDPYPVETYNDLDGDLCNFFRTLRDDGDTLIEQIALTPFSREELGLAGLDDGTADPIERARRFFVRARQCRAGLAQTRGRERGQWSFKILHTVGGKASSVSAWLNSAEGLYEIAERLIRVQIENDSALNVIKRYDKPQTVFYVDPPYVHATRQSPKAYAYEMTDNDHRELGAVLRDVTGRVVLSGYRSDLYDDMYKGWRRIDDQVRSAASARHSKRGRTASLRQDCVWLNF